MDTMITPKILLFDDFVRKVETLKNEGKTVVQSHGVFDLIHPGIIEHFNDARKQGDVLVVTVIKDKDVRRGPGRPIFTDKLRAENVASLHLVDYVCVVDDETPFECIKRIKPDVFAKGQGHKERDAKIHDKIFEDERELYFGKSKIYETCGYSLSSSSLVNSSLDIYPEEVKAFLGSFAKRYDFNTIVEKLKELKELKVLLIGDGIIDEYCYCETMGKSPKAQLVVTKYINAEVFAGGAFAIANHVAGFCGHVHLVTLLGEEDSREDFVRKSLKPNVSTRFVYRSDGPTIVKRRYINQYQKQKMFEINYINDTFIDGPTEEGLIGYLKTVIGDYDLVLVSDFGHGLVTRRLIEYLESASRKMAVNTQTNGANAGYNMITKYKKIDFVCLDATEARLAAQERYLEVEDVARKLMSNLSTDYLIITLGAQGSLCMSRDGRINRTPALSTKVVDIIGAGDAFFSYTAPCFAYGMPADLVCFIGNAVGALAVQIVGNKKAVEKYELLEFIHSLLQ